MKLPIIVYWILREVISKQSSISTSMISVYVPSRTTSALSRHTSLLCLDLSSNLCLNLSLNWIIVESPN
uniref:Uncharacterized protein n=1 Tax=Arundo donax TaxID=35708 RepID=A0A0A9HG58_ARUDO